jgi:hypothetical protein
MNKLAEQGFKVLQWHTFVWAVESSREALIFAAGVGA